jgi:hypothetical protein
MQTLKDTENDGATLKMDILKLQAEAEVSGKREVGEGRRKEEGRREKIC